MPNPGISFFIEKKSSKLKLMPKLGIRTGVRPIDDREIVSGCAPQVKSKCYACTAAAWYM